MISPHRREFEMEAEFSPAGLRSPDLLVMQRRLKQLGWALGGFALLCIIGFAVVSVLIWHQSVVLTRTRTDILFGSFVHYDYDTDDYVAPVVNAIQFFHDGYSLQFNKLEYTPEGLLLSGEIGNPNQFRILHLNLTFAVRPFPEKIKEKWVQSGTNVFGWSPQWDLGRATTNVGDLPPGRIATFTVTVPGVKQTSDPIRIAVLFSGEHYIYPATTGH